MVLLTYKYFIFILFSYFIYFILKKKIEIYSLECDSFNYLKIIIKEAVFFLEERMSLMYISKKANFYNIE